MATAEKNSPDKGKRDAQEHKDDPQWADGLKKLYNSVVEEPLPDSFQDLLAKLDADKS
ncbi:NepR family anti-sigma factor [Paraurantiacibacter namhicola]|uniref:Anti-sigma factor NepR domain-containing protein n=1 Tax=Paraurantiacibacter namhicola TaxID=645517 RepID=A0A1C7DBT8_9SPHN|nr:NepR family anti-sigma factor [Paraurantiacibacter namhicola]ANU08781.1 hypothetical protein A6F65_02502 [Paraurantiacibacter namhicola]